MSKTREATRRFRIQQWSQIIHDRVQSGMTIKEYCRKNQLSRDAYFYWARIIKEQAITELTVTEQQFVELPASREDIAPTIYPGSGSEYSELLLTVGQVQITVTEKTSSDLLSRTLEVVRNAL